MPSFIAWMFLPVALAAQQPYGAPVADIAIDGAPPSALERIPLRTGDLLTPDAVHDSIQALYDHGQYGQIAVDAVERPDGGIRLTFRVEEPYFLATIRMTPDNLLERPLSSYIDPPYGQRFSQTQIDAILDQLAAQLEAEGYFRARITPTYERDADTRLVRVTFLVEPGARARVRSIRFEGGEQTFRESELAAMADADPGDPFIAEEIAAGAEAIRTAFAELGFLNTSVTARHAYDSEANAVDATMGIQPGPFTLVQVRGYDLSDDRVRELVPVFEEGSVDPDLIEEGRVEILEHLHREGFFQASVRSELIEAPLDDAFQINYIVEPGDRHSVREIRIEGNMFFEDARLRQAIGISPEGLFSRGVFSPELLEEAARTITTMYSRTGFRETRVTSEYFTEADAIIAVLDVNEGRRIRIADIAFSGNTAIESSELVVLAGLLPDQVYTPAAVEQGRSAITSAYHARGYPEVRVSPAVIDAGDEGVGITYRIEEGRFHRIGRIFVAGNTRTQEKIVHRNSRLFEGTPYDRQSILQAQQRLYATGLFNRVDIVPLERNAGNARDLLIHLEDASPLLLTYGVGFQEREGARGTVEISHTNLFGLDRALSFRVRGSRREQRVQTTYREPRLFNWEVDGFASLFFERTRQRFFDANRIDFSFQSLKQFVTQDRLLLSASYQTVNLRDIRVNPRAGEFPEERGIIQIARLGASYIHDTRNDAISPGRGNYLIGTFQFANQALGSEVNFTSMFTQANIYRPAGGSVIAASARFGWNQPYGSTRSLPITERYFAGGSTTLRAFELDEAGPEGGGNALAIANAEYRFPIPLGFPGFGGALFYDTGTTFRRVSDFQFGDFTHTAGFGLRYQTPLGPVRVDMGFNLNRQPGDSASQIHFTLGHTF